MANVRGHQIGRRRGVSIADGGPQAPAAVRALQAGLAHQPGHSLARAAHAQLLEFGMDAGRTIGAAALAMDGADAGEQALISLRPRGGRPSPPHVIAAGGDA